MDSSGTNLGLTGPEDAAALRAPAELSSVLGARKEKTLPSILLRYGTALLLVAAAFLLSLGMERLFSFPYPFLFLFFGAVMASAWIGGTGAGLFAVFISTLVVDYFFVPPFYSLQISATAETYFVSFVVCALVANWVSAAKKRAEEALREARDQLELKVSERTAALLRTQTELAHLSRALSMGELTASIAHEINQPLTAVVANGHACVEWLSASPPNIAKARQSAESIIQDGTRAGAVVGRIRALFRKEAPVKDWVDVNDVIKELAAFLRHEAARRQIVIRTDLAPLLPNLKADRVQLQQVLLNLMINAMDSMSEIASAASKDVVITSRQEDSRSVVISVRDSGAGFRPDFAEKMFDPFFTTKSHGIGLGLSISKSIIESHQGRLWATPNPDGGAIFQFTLPIKNPHTDV
jgi:signal transduction histidine kinase